MMATEHTIQDNFLDRDVFRFISDQLMGDHFPWNYMAGVVGYADTQADKDGDYYYFTHGYYRDNKFWTNYGNVFDPLIDALGVSGLMRVKANLYPNVGHYHQHGWHSDFKIKHTVSLLYINSNNGHTVLEDGTKIESRANRLLTFDGSLEHASTTCTDQNVRVNIGVNYI
jgi:hypothetical protein|tara:strand:- start:1262 stop:1771 length:510 start_codon:yes stop_codon:yes gene_type:complete